MKSSTVVLSLLFINYVMADIDFDKQEKIIEMFAKGTHPDANNEIFKQAIQLGDQIYDYIFESMEVTHKNEPDKYLGVVKGFLSTIKNILKTIRENMKSTTDWGEMLKIFVINLVEVPEKKLTQVKETTEGKKVEHITKKKFMEEITEATMNAKKRLQYLMDHKKAAIEESSDVIRLSKWLVNELGKIKTTNKIDQTLIRGICIISRKINAFIENLVEKVKSGKQ